MVFSIIPAGIGYGIEECIMSSPSILHVRTMLSRRTFSREKFEIDEIARQVGTDQPCKTAPCMIDIPATIRREALEAFWVSLGNWKTVKTLPLVLPLYHSSV